MIRPSFASLRTKLVLLVFLAYLPAFGSQLLAAAEHRATVSSNALERARQLTRLATANQTRLVDQARQLLTTLSRLPEVSGSDWAACSTLLDRLLEENSMYANLGVVTPGGDVACSAVPTKGPVRVNDRAWFQRALQTRGFAIGDYQIGRITGKPTVNVAYPALADDGRVKAVVFAALDLAWLGQVAKDVQLPEGAALTVLDKRGTILVRHPDAEIWVGKSVPDSQILQAVLSHKDDGTAEVRGLDGVERFYAFATLGGVGDTGVYLTIGIPKAVLLTEVNKLLIRNLVGLGLLAGLMLIVAVVGGDLFVLRRVRALVAATTRLNGGDLGARTGVAHGDGELSQLARAFDDMAATLQARHSEAAAAAEALRRSAERLKLLHEMDKAILEAQSPEAIAQAALQQIWGLVPCQRAGLTVFDFDANEARVLAVHAPGRTVVGPGTRIPLETLGDLSEIFRELRRGTVVTQDIQTLPQSPPMQALQAEGLRYMNRVPVMAGEDLIGNLTLWTDAPATLTPEHIDIAREVADQLGVAIQQSRMREGLQRHAAELEHRVSERTAELDEAKTFLEHLIATSPGVIFKANPVDFTATYVSQNAGQLLGYSAEEIVGVSDFILTRIHPEDRERLIADIRQTLEEKRLQAELECRFLHKNGEYRWLYLTVRFEYAETGHPISVLGYALDVTERKHVQDALKQARLEADRANQAKTDFLSRMSHELRTPLNAILGFAQLLAMDSLNPEQRESIEDIIMAGRHLLQLINEVLDIESIEAGRIALSPEPVEVQEVIQEAIEIVRPLAAQRKVHLSSISGQETEYVLADRQRLKQVLLNLLSNAIKYNRENGTVTLSHERAPGARLRIAIADTGRGISQESLANLFTPFDRLGAEQTGEEGTGLGLALSKRLVEAMGGTIGVQSTVEHGSTFWVELALTEGPIERHERMTGRVAPTQLGAKAVEAVRTVLYIEDNLSNLRLIKRVLARWPRVRLLEAMQGRLGFDLAREHRPDLILLDLHLPDITGDEVLRRLRDTPETRHIPVVIISADATKTRVNRLLTAGAHAYLTKPLDVGKLLTIMEDALKERVG